jgi:periplasmic divalent cation tolerance protein
VPDVSAIAVVTTVGDLDQARAMGRALVERGLAACAQITRIESIYRWRGAMQDEPEFRLMLKTTEDRYAAVETEILRLHPYDLPAIHALALAHVHAPYAEWIAENSAGC